MALQWIQRVRLLAELGIGEPTAPSIVSENLQYPWDLRTLQNWNAELESQPAPLGVRADGCLDRHPDPFLDPLGSIVLAAQCSASTPSIT